MALCHLKSRSRSRLPLYIFILVSSGVLDVYENRCVRIDADCIEIDLLRHEKFL